MSSEQCRDTDNYHSVGIFYNEKLHDNIQNFPASFVSQQWLCAFTVLTVNFPVITLILVEDHKVGDVSSSRGHAQLCWPCVFMNPSQ